MLKKLLINERFIFSIIILNSIIIFIEGFNFEIGWLNIFDHFFTAIFLAELIIKIKVNGFKKFFESAWNIFDFVLITLALPSLASIFFHGNFIALDFLLVFRILRIFKFVRFIKFIPKIDKILNGLKRASKASILIIIGFFIFNFIVSLISCFLFRSISPENFGNPLISFYSIFKVFTIEGWYEIPDAMTQDSNPTLAFFIRIYFIVILFFGGVFGLSLVNSIFVDAMVSDNNQDLEEEIKRLHLKIDKLTTLKENLEA